MAGLKLGLALAISCILLVRGDDDHGTVAPNYSALSFAEEITKTPHFIMFYAPWCGHCKKLAPAWDQLAEFYAESDKAAIAKVDCTVEKDLCTSQGVSGYPTVKWFNKAPIDAEKYKGGRDLETLKAFVETKTGEPAAPKEEAPKAEVGVEGVEALIKLSPDNWEATLKTESVFIKFYAPWCGHCKRLAPAWEELAAHYKTEENIAIANIDCTLDGNKEICGKFEVRGYPTLLFFKNGEMLKKYQGAREIGELTKFVDKIRGTGVPLEAPKIAEPVNGVVDLNADTFEKHTEKGLHFIKFYAPWCGHCKRLAPVWEELAGAFKDSKGVSIAKVDCTGDGNANVCSKFEVRGYPTLLFFKDGQMAEKYQGARDMGDLKKYVNKKLGESLGADAKKTSEDGKIPAKAASEPTVENGVTVYNGDNFAAGVAKGTTFVKFYAPWCGHCKRLAPIWEVLGKAYETSDKVKIAKVDCTTDKEICTQFGVRGYPTLKLFRDGEVAHDYSGARDQVALEKFIESKVAVVKDEL